MKVFVIGLGSMGKRRIGILQNYPVEIIGIDNNPDRRDEANKKCGITTTDSLNQCKINVGDCAVICTSPLSHNTIIHECLEKGLHVFSEINLVSDGYKENIQLAKSKNLVLFLSSTFLYRSETQYLINRVHQVETPINYIYHVGQYLPDWHPWESYNQFFVGNKKTNGCREIFAIELPWIISCFGEIESLSVKKRNLSGLELSYNDTYLVVIQHKNGTLGMFAVDVVSRSAVRRMEIYGENIHLIWNGLPDSVFDYDFEQKAFQNIVLGEAEHKDGYASFVSENPYKEEIKEFFGCIKNTEKESRWSFEKDLEVLDVINKIEA